MDKNEMAAAHLARLAEQGAAAIARSECMAWRRSSVEIRAAADMARSLGCDAALIEAEAAAAMSAIDAALAQTAAGECA